MLHSSMLYRFAPVPSNAGILLYLPVYRRRRRKTPHHSTWTDFECLTTVVSSQCRRRRGGVGKIIVQSFSKNFLRIWCVIVLRIVWKNRPVNLKTSIEGAPCGILSPSVWYLRQQVPQSYLKEVGSRGWHRFVKNFKFSWCKKVARLSGERINTLNSA